MSGISDEKVSTAFLHQWNSTYGVCSPVTTTGFQSELFADLYILVGFKHIRTIVYRFSSSALVDFIGNKRHSSPPLLMQLSERAAYG